MPATATGAEANAEAETDTGRETVADTDTGADIDIDIDIDTDTDADADAGAAAAAAAAGSDDTPAPAAAAAGPDFTARAPATSRPSAERRARLLTGAAIAALLLLLALQIVLADRDRLASDAGWRAAAASVCGLLGCELPPWREPAAIVLVSREVRPDAARADALHVRASFRNDAPWPQPWPRLLLTLSDVDGRAVAARAFEPHEYLGATPDALFAPGQTADIALDIHEPSTATVSYAFDFSL